jgi:hypothetical protein
VASNFLFISSSFAQYLKAQKKRNVRQILCYAKRYHKVLETGDASALVNLQQQSGSIKRHAMEAITAYAKYSGCYDKWCQIRKALFTSLDQWRRVSPSDA